MAYPLSQLHDISPPTTGETWPSFIADTAPVKVRSSGPALPDQPAPSVAFIGGWISVLLTDGEPLVLIGAPMCWSESPAVMRLMSFDMPKSPTTLRKRSSPISSTA